MALNSSAIVILGASGDLAKRKLLPALLELYRNGTIERDCLVIGSGRTEFSNQEFREHIELEPEFNDNIFYHPGIEGLHGYVDSLGNFKQIIIFMALPRVLTGKPPNPCIKKAFVTMSGSSLKNPSAMIMSQPENSISI